MGNQIPEVRKRALGKLSASSISFRSLITGAIGHSMVLTFRVHYIRIKSLLFWDGTPFRDFLPPKYCSSGHGTFNSSHTDVVEKANFLVTASQHGGTSVAEGSP